MMNVPHGSCPDCDSGLSRRDFVRVLGSATLAAGAGSLLPRAAFAAPKTDSAAETAVKRLYDTLSDEQKKVICLPFGHEARRTINANWHVTKPTIGDDFYTDAQRALTTEIVKGVSSEDGYERFLKQMDYDDGGIDAYSMAIFGEPGTDKFQWLMTGRHLTLRADGNSVKNMAFGGPIVYGHGEEDPKENLFHYQTKAANEVFSALDTKQREQALIAKAPKENAVLLQGEGGRFKGVRVGDMTTDQRELVEKVVKIMLAPYRTEDVEESLAVLKTGGDFNELHMAFYQEGDLNDDRVWDIYRVEGPTFVWHFRGAPHVHTYLNVGIKQA